MAYSWIVMIGRKICIFYKDPEKSTYTLQTLMMWNRNNSLRVWEETPPGFLNHIRLLATFSWIRCLFSILERSKQQGIERRREVKIRDIQCTILRNKINSKCLRLSQENHLGINNSSWWLSLSSIRNQWSPLVVSVLFILEKLIP